MGVTGGPWDWGWFMLLFSCKGLLVSLLGVAAADTLESGVSWHLKSGAWTRGKA